MAMEVVDVEAMHRYELLEDGELLGYVSYTDRPVDEADGDAPSLLRDLQHTVIEKDQRGRGLGSVLVPAVLEDLRGRGAKLIPTCPFIRSWLDEHPDDRDLVA
jgi:predicted GNAT family acetyltransferase